MIPVSPADEPGNFDAKVRQPGLNWLAGKGLAGLAALPPKTKIRAYWTECLPELLSAYDRICAYASLKIHPVTGAHSVEHFAPKSRAPNVAYEWNNYRLACAKLNARKNNFTDVLDPFLLQSGTFELGVLDGSISPSKSLTAPNLALAQATMDRLNLDDQEMRAARLYYIDQYLQGRFDSDFLREESPFIWFELQRQGLLKSS
ncbi:MAG TPA: hypothetical protein VGO55_13420 [Allosphingosinicella sp.]|jgi:uncharacterized protein (TIGR02646 family)|nr:hypothetical protein [Allosphingosinicella sp.]